MTTAEKMLASSKRATVSEARGAYFAGDFERCLEICAQIRIGSVATASEVALLRARAHLRTGSPGDAQIVLRESQETHTTLDASLTAQMLLASAHIRQSDPDRGLAILHEAAAGADDAHFAVRSEIAFATALGYWAKREIDTAERYLELVDRRSDIIHARALELSAWCQSARGNHRRSAEFFILTLLRLDMCRAHDRVIAANAISTLAMLAAEFCDAELARIVEHRARTMVWTSGLVTHRFMTLTHQALFAETSGQTVEAYELALRAHEVAPSPAFEACAWSVISIIARNADEKNAAMLFGQRARDTLATIDLRTMSNDERFATLAVAECCAHFAPTAAERLFSTYYGLSPVDKIHALSGDPRLAAEETYVAGLIAEGRGDIATARHCYHRAFTAFREIGYLRRALVCAHALVKLDADVTMAQFIRDNIGSMQNYLRRAVSEPSAALPALVDHPIVASLPRAQREVVLLMCQGKSNKEIAALRNVGEQTIKNMLTKHIFRAFGVTSRAALVSLCLRRTPLLARSEFTASS